jgi:sodium transport system permease protein
LNRIGAWRATLIVARKELTSALRDRQTRAYTLLMPLVMYPALFWVALQASLLAGALRSARVVDVAVVAEHGVDQRVDQRADERAAALVDALSRARDARESAEQDAPEGDAAPLGEPSAEVANETSAATADTPPPTTRFAAAASASNTEELESRLANDEAQAFVFVPNEGALVVVHDASRSASRLAHERTTELLDVVVEREREALLGTPPDELAPYDFERRDVAAPEQLGAFLLSTMLPIMLIAMATMGAFFPAVDVTAGEKERKSAETTLLLPVPRAALFGGQLLSVATASLFATLANLLGMSLAANHLLGMLTDKIQFALPVVNVLLMLPLMAAFALFLGATLTACASFTDTFKQGQALLGTVQTAFILPAMASVLPGIEFSVGIAAVPVVGASLGLREILRADGLAGMPWLPLGVSLVSMAVCAALAIVLATRAMQREPGTTPKWVRSLTGAKENS